VRLPVNEKHAEAMTPLLREAAKAVPSVDLLMHVDLDTLTPEMLYSNDDIGSPILVHHLIEMLEGTEEIIDSSEPITEGRLRKLAAKQLQAIVDDLDCMILAMWGTEDECPGVCDGCNPREECDLRDYLIEKGAAPCPPPKS